MSRNIFDHAPLDLALQQIRLVRFESSSANPDQSNDTSIRLCMSHHALEDAPFVAVSYAWGPVSPTRNINIDGRELAIRDNLYQFLQIAKRKFPAGIFFWIDQICIDADNVEEKNRQVQFMGEIFRNASSVVAWLGPEGDDSEFVKGLPGSSLEYRTVKFGRKHPAFNFMSRSFFSRLWVVQELVLARELEFWCGDVELSLDDLGIGITHPHKGLEVFYFWDAIETERFARASKANPRTAVHDLIPKFHQESRLQCEREHDMIYGLLGMVDIQDRLVVDYRKPKLELFHEVIEKTMNALIGQARELSLFVPPCKTIFEEEKLAVMLSELMHKTERVVVSTSNALGIPRLFAVTPCTLWNERLPDIPEGGVERIQKIFENQFDHEYHAMLLEKLEAHETQIHIPHEAPFPVLIQARN